MQTLLKHVLKTQGFLEFGLERGLYLYGSHKEEFTPAKVIAACNIVQFVVTYLAFPRNFRGSIGLFTGEYLMILISAFNVAIQYALIGDVQGKEILLVESVCALLVFYLLLTQLRGSFSLCEAAFIAQTNSYYFGQYFHANSMSEKICYLLLNQPLSIALSYIVGNQVFKSKQHAFCLAIFGAIVTILYNIKYNIRDFLEDTFAEKHSVTVCLFYILVIIVGSLIISRIRHSNVVKNVIVRKLFHFQALLMFLVGIYYAPKMQRVAFAGALFVFFVLEMARSLFYTDYKYLNQYHQFIVKFLDEKDSNHLVITHIYLLFACAHPFIVNYHQGLTSYPSYLICVSGLLIMGLQDSFAAIIGSIYGKIKIFGSSKTLEGLFGGFLALSISALLIKEIMFPSYELYSNTLLHMSGAFFAISCLEAYTKQVDNIILPIVFMRILALVF